MATVQLPPQGSFRLDDVDWLTYRRLLRAFDNRHVRLTYDRGSLEFMTLSPLHEHFSSLLGQFVEVLTEELQMPRRSAGSTTLKRKKRLRGLEPDRSYYLANEPLVRGKETLDLRRDPPPDLGIEIDVTHSSLNRMAIYAALKVPEVWRFDGQALVSYHLQANGTYVANDRSLHFSFLSLKDVNLFLQRRTQMDETSLVRSFRAWVREQIAKGWPAST